MAAHDQPGTGTSRHTLISGTFVACLLVTLADTLGHHFVRPVLVPYGFLLGASLPVIAFFSTVRFVTVMISMMWMPIWADRFGTKSILIISLVGSAVAYLVSGLALYAGEAGTTQVATMFGGCGLAGFFGGTSPILQAVVARTNGNSETTLRARLMLLTVAGNVFPVALMPLAGSMAMFGLNLPWLVAAITTCLILVACISIFKEPVTAPNEPKGLDGVSSRGSGERSRGSGDTQAKSEDIIKISSPFADKKLLLLSVSCLLCFVSVGGFGLTMPILLSSPSFGLVNPDDVNASRKTIATAHGLVSIPFGCCNLLFSSWVFLELSKRVGERYTLLLGVICGSAALAAHGFAGNMLQLAALQALLGCGVGLILPGIVPIVSKWALHRFPTQGAQAQAVPGMGSMLGMMLGPIILSILIGDGSRAELQLTFLVAAVCPIFGLLVIIKVSMQIDQELKVHKWHKEAVHYFDEDPLSEQEFVDSMCQDLRGYLTRDGAQYRNFLPTHHVEQQVLLRALDAAFAMCPAPDEENRYQKHLAFVVSNFWHLLTLEDKLTLQASELELELPEVVERSLSLIRIVSCVRPVSGADLSRRRSTISEMVRGSVGFRQGSRMSVGLGSFSMIMR